MDAVLAHLLSPDNPAGAMTAFAVLAAVVVVYLIAIVTLNHPARMRVRKVSRDGPPAIQR